MDTESLELSQKIFLALRKQIRTSADTFVEDFAGDLTDVGIHGEVNLQKLAEEVLR